MSTISTKINLTQFKHVIRKMQGKEGIVDCIVLPIDTNHFYRGEKGVYADFRGFELKEKRENQTHLVKQSYPKEVFDKMTDQEKSEMPIVGSHLVWAPREPDPIRVELHETDQFSEGFNNDLPF